VLLFLAAFALFMVPGLVLALAYLPGPNLAGMARVPLAFTLSAGIYGLAALPGLLISSLRFYPLVWGIILLALSLRFAVLRIIRKRVSAEGEEHPKIDLSTALLWVPFSLLMGALAWISAVNLPRPAEDAWIYLAHVRDIVELGSLKAHGSSRLLINGWLPEQAGLSRISGLDPIELVLRYLAPTLIVVALLALYALARTILKNEKAALVIGSLSALFFLVNFGSPSFHSILAPGGEFIDRITEDKYVARYIFLSVALSLAILFLRDRSRRNLGLFFFVCLSSALVHPLGLVFIGASVAGLGLVHLALNRRDREAWLGVGGLWIVLLLLTGPPALYLLATGSPLLSRLDALDPGVATTLIDTEQYEQRLLEIWEGSFVLHPSFLLDPAMLVAYLLGIPFLIWKARNSLGARLLLGTLAFVPVLVFVPYVATLISGIIGPWLLHRLAWPLLLAALLTLGWICWEALRFAGSRLGEFAFARHVAPFLPLVVVVYLLINAVPLVLTGIRAANASDKSPQTETTCEDPVFRWMQSAIPDSGRVMAPRLESGCVTAYTASAKVLGARGRSQSDGEQDQEAFYNAPTFGPDSLRILQSYEADYVMLPLNSPLNTQLEHLPGFNHVENPSERYRMYAIQGRTLEPTSSVVIANGNFNDEEWDAAIEAYTEALEGDPDERFLAYLGLGRANAKKDLYAEAVENYQAALEIDPESPDTHDLLATAYNEAGEKPRAREEFEKAVELDPENVDLHLRYGQFLASIDPQAALQQHLAVVEAFPKVPEYRAELGSTLLLAGNPEAADKEFERAVYLSPLSAKLQADIGRANLLAQRPEEALRYYERALDLEPNNQLYTMELGRVHARLSTRDGRDEDHFEEAEALLKRVEELSPRLGQGDQREAAWYALGDLYLAWDRPGDAAAAFEQALELNPNSKRAQERLDGLR
jgi:tetratricopeptide (TPR) repeat protein